MTTKTEKYLRLFETFSNGEMGTEAIRDFEDSLKSDLEMSAAWSEYQRVLEAIKDHEAISLRIILDKEFEDHWADKNIRTISSSRIKWSAAAVVLILLGSLIYFFCSNKEPDNYANKVEDKKSGISIISEDMAKQDSLNRTPNKDIHEKKVPESDQIALLYEKEEYKISPMYSELLNNVYRNTWFKLITPKDSIFVEKNEFILFTWETSIKDSIYFDVLNRKGRVIYRHNVSVESPWSYKAALTPAIYMFRFSTKEQPVWMGVMGVMG